MVNLGGIIENLECNVKEDPVDRLKIQNLLYKIRTVQSSLEDSRDAHLILVKIRKKHSRKRKAQYFVL